MGARKALLVATDTYNDPKFGQLRAPAADVDALTEVLSDPAIGGYGVHKLHNATQSVVNRAIEDFFVDARPDDLLVLYVSGHGVKGDTGQLFLAMTDSRQDRLSSTAVSAHFIHDQLVHSRSRRIVVLLDCCYAGAFPLGMRHRAGEQVDVLAQLSGRGCAVMTSSSALEYAFEPSGQAATLAVAALPSVFTGALIDGLRTGDADRDGDGLVDIDELYDYTYDRVRDATPHQTPQRMFDLGGKLHVATSPRGPRSDTVLSPLIIPRTAQPPNGPIRSTNTAVTSAPLTGTIITPTQWPAIRRNPRLVLIGAATSAVLLVVVLIWALWPTQGGAGDTSSAPPGSNGNPAVPPPTAREAGTLSGHTSTIAGMEFSGDGHILATASADNTVRLWDVANHKELGQLATGLANGVALSRDGRTVAVAPSGRGVQFWDVASHQQIGESLSETQGMPGLPIMSMAVEFSPDSRLLATGEVSGQVRLWDVASHQQVGEPLIGHTSGVIAMAFSADGRILATSGADTTVRLWDVANHQQLGQLPTGSTTLVQSLAFSPDGRILAAAVSGLTTQFWDVASRRQVGQPINNSPMSLAFSPDGHVLVTAGVGQGVQLWDVASHQQRGQPIGPATAAMHVSYSPDGHILATAMLDNTVRLWDMTGLG